MNSVSVKGFGPLTLALAIFLASGVARAHADATFSAGFAQTCAIKSDGTLWCWGRNFDGELGIGSSGINNSQRTTPVLVSSLGNDVVEVAAGDTQTCARMGDATLWCWGAPYLGYSNITNPPQTDQSTPVPITSLGPTLPGIAAGSDHYCVISPQHTLFCWGSNSFGQIGNGNHTSQPIPIPITSSLGDQVVEVAASYGRTCARKSDGTLWCWGFNGGNEIKDGSAAAVNSPFQIADLGTSVAEVSLGLHHTCARTIDGAVYCWGVNFDGQTGNDFLDPWVPSQIAELGNNVAKLWSGNGAQAHSCAILTDGTLWCWGRNFEGQLGNGDTTGTGSATPVQVTALGSNVVDVSAGNTHTCARKTDGSLWCWGTGPYGEIGDGSVNVARYAPVSVPGFAPPLPPPAAPAMRRGLLAALAALLAMAGWALADVKRFAPTTTGTRWSA